MRVLALRILDDWYQFAKQPPIEIAEVNGKITGFIFNNGGREYT